MLRKTFEYIRRRKAALAAQRQEKARRSAAGNGVQAGVIDRAPLAKGHVTIQTRPVDTDGKPSCDCAERGVGCTHWNTVYHDDNLVVTLAERIMAQMAIGASGSALLYIELGDPTAPANPPALSDLGLQQSTGQRKTVVLTAAGNIVTAEAIWTSGEGNGPTYTEAGLFNGPTLGSGLMFARKTFAGIQKLASFEMRFSWLITFLVNTQGGDCAGISLIGPSTVTAYSVYDSGTDTGGAGGEQSVSVGFDFVVGNNHLDVFLNGQRLVPGQQYTESSAATVAANPPVGGPAGNKGIVLNGFTLQATGPTGPDQVFIIQRTLA